MEATPKGGNDMGWLVLLVLLAVLLGGAGFVLHVLWWVAIIAVALLLIGFVMPSSGGRWYRW
jgi:energy-converting hydrogenase Eha subunit C